MSGHRIAGYRLEEEIGHGGMAVVYRARDLRLGRTVAVKLLAPELARNDTFRGRFVQESRVAAAIDHPHIVPVFEAGEADGVLYIAMRYVRGSDLRALLDRTGRLPLETACRIALQVASALDAAHAHQLVHRDVKPGNVLIADDPDDTGDLDHADAPGGSGSGHGPDHEASEGGEYAYLTDFGLTKRSLSLTGFTRVGQFVGTLDYVAPEQIAGRPVDGRCDVYSLACVTFEMLTGAPPFRRDDDMALLWAHQFDPAPPPTTLRPDLPPAVDEPFARALAKSPADRQDSCRAFVRELRAAGRTGAGRGAVRPAVGAAEARTAPVDRRPPEPPRWAAPVFPAAW
ncbi:serine/threonine protein kinase [Streptomyces sp. NA04227]|uniref:serine/threonine-protein kinase n=1 Tax=Streptomyces sp. NA04227 TaxID=2742136 RepID=UPI0015926DF3|nr:serine/threonine-protein kinase [Streptomyces sp. NA04227]QKW10841.1 serine/threonine protein kinase [Streptomyces sp. NA04227]